MSGEGGGVGEGGEGGGGGGERWRVGLSMHGNPVLCGGGGGV